MDLYYVSATVRIVNYGSYPFVDRDVVVEKKVDGQWITHWSADSSTNDMALFEADQIARELAKQEDYDAKSERTSKEPSRGEGVAPD